MGHCPMMVAIVGAAVLALCVGLPQIPSYSVQEVNQEVFDEVDNVETTKSGSKYIESKVALVGTTNFNPDKLLKDFSQLEVNLIKADSEDGRNAESSSGTKYVEVQEKIEEDGLLATDVASEIAFEILDEVGDHLGSRGASLKKMELLLKNARGK